MLAAYTVKSAPASIAILPLPPPLPPPRRHQCRPIWVLLIRLCLHFPRLQKDWKVFQFWIFKTIKNMQEAINSYEEKLEASEAGPYMIFRLVTTDDLLKIERARENGKIDRGVRLTHYVDWDILILKVPTAEHEIAYRTFSDQLFLEAVLMGLRWELVNVGATTFKTPRMSKEGDSAFKPLSIRPHKADW